LVSHGYVKRKLLSFGSLSNQTKMNWTNTSIESLLKLHNRSDPVELIRELTRELVLRAYNLGWSGPPFDPIQLATILNLSVLPNENILDARIIPGRGDSLIIEYNPYQREARINFSIAHEIGHTFFPDCGQKVRNREEDKDTNTWELEFLCDIAASEFLLPYAEFTQEANAVPLSLQSLLDIANKYKASVESVFLRFCEVVDKPCTIILASFTDEAQKSLSIDYSKSSKKSVLSFDKTKTIPNTSHAFECLNPGWTSYGKENWATFGNTEYLVSSIGLPPIKKQKRSRVGILLVPEHYQESSTGNILIVNGDATKPRGAGIKIIVQIVNTSGGLGFGFGRAMSKNWPASKQAIINWMKDKDEFSLGESKLTRLSDEVYVYQMIAQKGIFPKEGDIPLRYDSLKNCLVELSTVALQMNATVHMPKIGSGQAKGDWGIIEGIIHDELISKGISVMVYVLPGSQLIKPTKPSTLSLFDENSLYEK
jgi:hypothetical protein